VDVREQQKKHWNAVAGGWAAWFDWTTRNFRPVADWFRDAAGWKPGARILDVACGAGFPALAAATSVRPGGTIGLPWLHLAREQTASTTFSSSRWTRSS
jgi:ubiquinone/menaquinone biosynthesis C-methylase UbiE